MAWSYRQDRADEIYSTTGGPSTVDGAPPAPVDEEGNGEGLEKPESPEPPLGEARDPQAGRKVPTVEERLRQESELTQRSADLEQERQRGMERNRIRAEERTRLQQEESDKEMEKIRKEEAENVKKEVAEQKKKDEKAKADREKEKVNKEKAQPVSAQAGPKR
jgi:Ca-activated chloride channel family protein